VIISLNVEAEEAILPDYSSDIEVEREFDCVESGCVRGSRWY
jgi:hypothetical protein